MRGLDFIEIAIDELPFHGHTKEKQKFCYEVDFRVGPTSAVLRLDNCPFDCYYNSAIPSILKRNELAELMMLELGIDLQKIPSKKICGSIILARKGRKSLTQDLTDRILAAYWSVVESRPDLACSRQIQDK